MKIDQNWFKAELWPKKIALLVLKEIICNLHHLKKCLSDYHGVSFFFSKYLLLGKIEYRGKNIFIDSHKSFIRLKRQRKHVTPGSLMVRGNRNYFYLFPLYTSTTFLQPLIKSYVILGRYSFFLQTSSDNALILQLISAA